MNEFKWLKLTEFTSSINITSPIKILMCTSEYHLEQGEIKNNSDIAKYIISYHIYDFYSRRLNKSLSAFMELTNLDVYISVINHYYNLRNKNTREYIINSLPLEHKIKKSLL